MTQEERLKILKALDERKISSLCPFCKKGTLTLVDGYVGHFLNEDYSKQMLSGRYMPSILLVCNHCGFLSMHALGALGLLPHNDQSEKK